jgi:hypothetical protein
MNHPIRVFLFTHYWWITPVLAVTAGVATINYSRPDNVPGNLLALCTVALGVIYFVQKQKVDDLQIFERLFTGFNQRYDDLHPAIQRVIEGQEDDRVRHETLERYFNLCAEEFLFFQQGRILPAVWQAWCRGMATLLTNHYVREHWVTEQQLGSYYGLTSDDICHGAGISHLPPVDLSAH